MKNKIKIAFDLDGVLIDMETPIKKFLLEIHGVELKDNYDEFNLAIPTGLSSKELWKIYRMVYKEFKNIPIYYGATELLTKLYEKTNEPPLILTARPLDVASDTYAVVKRIMGKIPFSLILKHPRADKAQYLHGYEYYVEDRRQNAIELSEAGFKIPLVRKNYNYIPDIIYKHPNIWYIDGIYNLISHIEYWIAE